MKAIAFMSKEANTGVPIVAQWLTNLTGIHEDVGSIPGLAQTGIHEDVGSIPGLAHSVPYSATYCVTGLVT